LERSRFSLPQSVRALSIPQALSTMSAQQRLPSTLWHAFVATLRSSNGQKASNAALISPQQAGIRWTYEDLQSRAAGLSIGLQDRGVSKGDVVATDLPNVAEGLVLHLACARLGATLATAKKAEVLQTIPNGIKCAVVVMPTTADFEKRDDDGAAWSLAREEFRSPHIVAGSHEMEAMLNLGLTSDGELDDDNDEHASKRPLGYFNSANALTHESTLQQGLQMKEFFKMNDDDRSCVSITLYHAFGIGSACSSAFLSGSAVVLPAVGGLAGCGVPSQRAQVTLKTLVDEKCSLLFADTHTLKALHGEGLVEHLANADLPSHLRGGVCKTGSGTDILNETVVLGGVSLATLGKRN